MKNIVFSILLLFGAVAIGFIYLAPEWRINQELRHKISQLNAVNDELKELGTRRDELKEKLNQIPEEDLLRLAQALPEGSDKKTFMVLLEELTKQNGVKTRSINITETDSFAPKTSQPQPSPFSANLATQNIKELGLQLTVESSYPAFKRFLASLENSLRLIDVFDITFGAAVGENSGFSIRAKTYYQ